MVNLCRICGPSQGSTDYICVFCLQKLLSKERLDMLDPDLRDYLRVRGVKDA